MLTPLVLEITRRLGRNPVPYLLAVAMASNIGSVATITGNPQNMMIGSFSGIPYRAFAAALAPVAAMGLVLTVAVIASSTARNSVRRERTRRAPARAREPRPALEIGDGVRGHDRFLLRGLPVPKVAVVAGALCSLHAASNRNASIARSTGGCW